MPEDKQNTEISQGLGRYRKHRVLGFGLAILVLLVLVAVVAVAHHKLDNGRMMAVGHRMPHYGLFGGGPGVAGGWYNVGYSLVRQPVSGTVSKISGNDVTVTANNGVTETVTLDANASITKSGSAIKLTDLKVGDSISVNGFTTGVNQLQARSITVQ
jgi:hypothetical protein